MLKLGNYYLKIDKLLPLEIIPGLQEFKTTVKLHLKHQFNILL